MPTRFECEVKLRDYPDLVTTKELALMLGGISEHTALSLLRKNKIESFRIGNRYKVPKVNVIDFMVTEEYEALRQRAESARFLKIRDKDERIRQKLLFLCETPQTRKRLMYLLDVKSIKTFFRLYLKPLLESGELQMTHPEHPSVSTQRYIRASASQK